MFVRLYIDCECGIFEYTLNSSLLAHTERVLFAFIGPKLCLKLDDAGPYRLCTGKCL